MKLIDNKLVLLPGVNFPLGLMTLTIFMPFLSSEESSSARR